MNEFDKLRKLWPNRQIFQGSAWAYIRYCESRRLPWEGFEKPLWKAFLRELNLKEASVLDIGSGTGRLVDLLIEERAKPENIFILEPNPILVNFLFERKLGVGCIRDSSCNLDNPVAQHLEADLVTANMVVNHLPTTDFDKLVKDIAGVLKLDGIFAYMVPNPYWKEMRYSLDKSDNSSVVVEDAPWGGLVEYHHKSEAYQRKILENSGFKPLFYFGGYDDTYHTLDGPKRMLVVAQKIKTVQEE